MLYGHTVPRSVSLSLCLSVSLSLCLSLSLSHLIRLREKNQSTTDNLGAFSNFKNIETRSAGRGIFRYRVPQPASS